MKDQSYSEGDIVSLLCPMGEIVGKWHTEENNCITLYRPRMLIHVPNADGTQTSGFAPGVTSTGELEPEFIKFYPAGIICVVKTNTAVAKSWETYTSKIKVASADTISGFKV